MSTASRNQTKAIVAAPQRDLRDRLIPASVLVLGLVLVLITLQTGSGSV